MDFISEYEVETLLRDAEIDEDGIRIAAIHKFVEECRAATSEWDHGASAINENYFVEYVIQLVNDCYALEPEEGLPWWIVDHLTYDWEGIADELKADHTDVEFENETYWIRSC